MDYELLSRLYDIDELIGYSDEEISELTAGFTEVPSALISFWIPGAVISSCLTRISAYTGWE